MAISRRTLLGSGLALPIAARFGAELRAAGVPADPGRCERFAGAVAMARPVTVSRDARPIIYLCRHACPGAPPAANRPALATGPG